jgi:hypothetical protein
MASAVTPEEFERVATLFVPERAQAIAFSPDGRLLAVAAADKVHIFRVPSRLERPDDDGTRGSAPNVVI